jgi:hypothetical protein
MQRFDVGILEGDHANPMHRIIKQRSGEWMTHCVVIKNEKGDLWDATVGGILNSNLFKDYPGRKTTILRYKHSINEDILLAWITKTQAECKGYDWASLIGFLTGVQSFDNSTKWFCSELGYELFQDNGYCLTRVKRTYVYPADLFYCNEFIAVEEIMAPGEPKEKPTEYEFPYVVG